MSFIIAMPWSYRATKRSNPVRKRTFKDKTLYAKVLSVYDGDTITVSTRLTSSEPFARYSVRLAGIDTPELRGPQRAAGLVVRDKLRGVLRPGRMVIIDFDSEDKYGRLLGRVYTIKGWWSRKRSVDICEWLVKCGYALRYDGGTKTEFTKKHLNSIVTGRKSSVV